MTTHPSSTDPAYAAYFLHYVGRYGTGLIGRRMAARDAAAAVQGGYDPRPSARTRRIVMSGTNHPNPTYVGK